MFYIMIRIWVIQVYAYLRFVHFILRTGKIKLKKIELMLCMLKYLGETIQMSSIYFQMYPKKDD